VSGRLIVEGIYLLEQLNVLLDVLVDPCIDFKLLALVPAQEDQKREVFPGWVDFQS
jgi:hypothetical protein